MNHFLKSTRFKVILFILALLVGIMIYAVSVGGYTLSAVSLFRTITAPFQRLSNSMSERVEHSLNVYRDAEIHYEQNKALKQEVAELQKQLADYEETRRHLEELQEFVGIKEEYKDLVLSAPCEVVSYVTNDPFGAFMIGQGSADGIELYDPVVTDLGLVGVITEVGDHTSKVTTILSPEVSVAVYCSTTPDHGVVTGSVSLAMEGLCRLQYLEKDSRIRKDKVILTSGENGLFPKGYVVGYVRDVQVDESGLNTMASIEPAAEISDLSMVIVIKDFEGKGVDRDE
ncbi:MAG: rod shape-determining protein MreC [Oscillospiraceae bacterium]|nr:rod shape-determining protein MreC [Oscillospiraceae bacterium]